MQLATKQPSAYINVRNFFKAHLYLHKKQTNKQTNKIYEKHKVKMTKHPATQTGSYYPSWSLLDKNTF